MGIAHGRTRPGLAIVIGPAFSPVAHCIEDVEQILAFRGQAIFVARLKLMEKQGVVERHAYQERPPRHEYRLTAKGKDLFDVRYAMRNWAERWA